MKPYLMTETKKERQIKHTVQRNCKFPALTVAINSVFFIFFFLLLVFVNLISHIYYCFNKVENGFIVKGKIHHI